VRRDNHSDGDFTNLLRPAQHSANVADETGQVCVNVNRAADEEPVFVAAEIAPLLKPHQVLSHHPVMRMPTASQHRLPVAPSHRRHVPSSPPRSCHPCSAAVIAITATDIVAANTILMHLPRYRPKPFQLRLLFFGDCHTFAFVCLATSSFADANLCTLFSMLLILMSHPRCIRDLCCRSGASVSSGRILSTRWPTTTRRLVLAASWPIVWASERPFRCNFAPCCCMSL